MALAIVYSRAVTGIVAPLVTVEVHLSNGMAGLHIVGLPETGVKESKDRVRSALINSQFEFPIRHITINLAPADLPKEGGRFDLPIALGILAASRQIPTDILVNYEFGGELALSGELRSIRGVLPMVLNAQQSGRQLIIPMHNAEEASLVQEAKVLCASHLLEVCAYLQGKQTLAACALVPKLEVNNNQADLSDIKGQQHAKRALEIAAAGGHHLLFTGPPGSGKTMLASRLPSILPILSDQEALEAAAVQSISHNGFDPQKWKQISFRSPHHTSSSVAIVGGGRPPRPGEISLAHRGVLFLDELPEFNRHVLECLREPIESGSITISRAAIQMLFPAKFQLLAAMNPCPCGYASDTVNDCFCSKEQIKRYLGKISGPLLERIDMHVEVARLSQNDLVHFPHHSIETSACVLKRVVSARSQQKQRQGKFNSDLTVPEIDSYCEMGKEAQSLLLKMMIKFNLSARVYHRIIKLARTIADLQGEEHIMEQHLGETLTYRCLDRLKKQG